MKRAVLVAVLVGCSVVGAAPLGLAAAHASPRAPAAIVATGPYGGDANADLLTVTAADFTGTPFAAVPTVLGLNLVHSEAQADSNGSGVPTGPDRTSIIAGDPALRTGARAANLDPLAVLQQNNLSSLLSEIAQTAPPDNAAPATKQLLDVPADPLTHVDLSTATALSHWAGDAQCVAASDPLSDAVNNVASFKVITTGVPGGSMVAADVANQGVIFSKATMSLPALPAPNPNDARFVQSQAVTQIAQLDLFGGSGAGGATVEIAGDPTLTATASGLPGGAHVTYTSPIVTINGNTVLDASTLGGAFAQLLDGLKPLLGGVAPLITLEASAGNLSNVVEAADGTAASADATLVHLKVNLLPAAGGAGITLLDLDIGPVHTQAFAPAGGIQCGQPQPLQVVKDAPDTVQAGDSFTQTITVTNTEPVCTLTAVKVTDLITGPAGSTVTSTDPAADSVAGSPESGGIAVTWNNIGDIGPGASKVLKVIVKTDLNAPNGSKFHDDATASGTCNGTPRDGSASLDKPVVTNQQVRVDVLPRTGGDDTALLVAAAALIGLAFGIRRLRLV
jgi:hypothetical protein